MVKVFVATILVFIVVNAAEAHEEKHCKHHGKKHEAATENQDAVAPDAQEGVKSKVVDKK